MELDPMGRDVGRSDPYAQDELADYGGSYGVAGNGFDDAGGGCEWNGLPILCSLVGFVARAHGASVIGVGVRRQGDETPGFAAGVQLREVWDETSEVSATTATVTDGGEVGTVDDITTLPTHVVNVTAAFRGFELVGPQRQTSTRGEVVYKEEKDRRGGSKLSPCANYIFRRLGFQSKINLEDVRIHIGIPKVIEEGAKRFGKVVPEAVTIGKDIYWRSLDDYKPHTVAGLARLGHELAHVYQWVKGGDKFLMAYLQAWKDNGYVYDRNMKYEDVPYEIEDKLNITIPQRFTKDPCQAFRSRPLP